MYVCICNAITEKQIRQAASAGVRDFGGLQSKLGVAAGCGSCKEVAAEILRESTQVTRTFDPVIYQPSLA